jgi:hypothetical protein
MTHPVFFSFAGDTKSLADRIKSRFADDLVYTYTRSGVDGTDFPEEILTTLAQCSVFVIFWSKAYVAADQTRPWCRRELITAGRRVDSGSLKHYIILQCDETPLNTPIINPDDGRLVDGLKPFRDTSRAFPSPINVKSVESFLSSELAQLMADNLPILPRPNYQQLLRAALDTGTHFARTPVVFVSGFNGTGRKTLIRSVMSSDFRHLTEFVISIDDADGPEDLLRLIWGEVLQKPVAEQRRMMKEGSSQPLVLARYFKQLGEQLESLRGYLVISKTEFSDVGEVAPQWITEYLGSISPRVQPLIFYTIPRPLPPAISCAMANISEVAVPSLEDDESERLVEMTIAACDPRRMGRWQPHFNFIVESGSNSPKLLVDIVRLASRRASLDFLEQNVKNDLARFDQYVVQVLDWAWPQIREREGSLLLLDVLNSLGVAHIDTFKELFSSAIPDFGQYLYDLVQFGVIEHLNESTYRIPPALRRKLNFYLINAELRKKTNDLLKQYARRVEIGRDQFGGVALTNAIQIYLGSDTEISPEDAAFVTAAMLFKAGWQRYRRGQHASALSLLRRAFVKLDDVKDEGARLEIAQYFGLAAAREASGADIDNACSYLARAYNFSARTQPKALASSHFIRGLYYRREQQYADAVSFFESALDTLSETSGRERLKSQILNELVLCLLRVSRPDYGRAVSLAKELCKMRETPNSLDVLLRALLAQTYFDEQVSDSIKQSNKDEIIRREEDLRIKCEGSNLSFYTFRLIDRLEKEAVAQVDDQPFGTLDLTAPIRICQSAYDILQEETLLCRKWDLMFRTERGRDWARLHEEAAGALERGGLNRTGKGIAARIKILTYDFLLAENRILARQELDKYKNKLFPRAVAAEITRKLALHNLSAQRILNTGGLKYDEF